MVSARAGVDELADAGEGIEESPESVEGAGAPGVQDLGAVRDGERGERGDVAG